MKIKDYHECTLSTKVIDVGLYPLPPNASRPTRFFRYIRKFCIMDTKNIKSKEFFRNKSTMLAEQKRHARNPYAFVVHPFSKLNNTIEIIFFVSWFWQYLSVPIINGFYFRTLSAVVVISRVVNALQYIVFTSFFFVGYVDQKRKEIIIEPKKIVYHYVTTFFFFDVIAVFFDDLLTFFITYDTLLTDFYSYNYFATVIVTFAYFVRFKYFLSVLRAITKILRLTKAMYHMIFHFIVVAFTIHILTCSLFSLPKLFYGNTFPNESWMVQANLHEMHQVYFVDVYSEAWLMAVCFFFGAAHEKYDIIYPNEEIILTITMMFGRLYTLYMIADLLKMFGLVGISESKYEQYLGQLEEYMSSKNLPDQLRIRLLKYYEYKLQKHYFNENQILTTLSEHLRTEMFLFGARKLIEKAQVLKTLPKATLGVLFAFMKSETFMPTDVITRVGAAVEDVYFISSGTIAVINSDGTEIYHLEDGDEFGFLVSLDGKQLYMHVAVETSEVYYISKKLLLEFFEAHPEIFKYFDTRIRKRIEKYRIVEENLEKGGDDVISALKSGKLLEKQNVRAMHFEFET